MATIAFGMGVDKVRWGWQGPRDPPSRRRLRGAARRSVFLLPTASLLPTGRRAPRHPLHHILDAFVCAPLACAPRRPTCATSSTSPHPRRTRACPPCLRPLRRPTCATSSTSQCPSRWRGTTRRRGARVRAGQLPRRVGGPPRSAPATPPRPRVRPPLRHAPRSARCAPPAPLSPGRPARDLLWCAARRPRRPPLAVPALLRQARRAAPAQPHAHGQARQGARPVRARDGAASAGGSLGATACSVRRHWCVGGRWQRA